MKMIVISSDGPALAYRVPDEVADALDEWCGDFCRWLWEGPERERYIKNGAAHYVAEDFIEHLNRWKFPDEPSVLAADLGEGPLPEEFRGCPHYWF